MSDIKLSDQLAVMALIDERYQQQMLLEEHLNTTERRQKLAHELRSYYAAKGVSVDDALIEEGISAWFMQRLRYRLPRVSRFQKLLARAYIQRGKVARGVSVLLLVLVGLYYAPKGVEWVESAYQNTVTRQRIKDNVLPALKSLADTQRQANFLAGYSAQIVAPYTSVLAAEYHEALANTPDAVLLSKVRGQSTEHQVTLLLQDFQHESAESVKQRTQQLLRLNTQLLEKVGAWQSLISQEKELLELRKKPTFTIGYKEFTPFKEGYDQATQLLANGKTADVVKVQQMLDQVETALQQRQQVQTLRNELNALKLTPAEKKTVQDQVENTLTDLKNLRLEGAEGRLQQLIYWRELASTNLRLMVVSREGEKTGVRRTYQGSGGNAWYLVVEALTPSNEVYPLWIRNSETGQWQKVSRFAVRVSEKEFNRVRRDKEEDGHIDNPLLASKPIGRLDFSYQRPVMTERITEW